MYPHVIQFETRQRELQREMEQLRLQEFALQTNREQQAAAPSRPRMALITWLGAYAVITIILQFLSPLIAEWPLALRTLLLSGLMVMTLTFAVMPTLTRLFRRFLIDPAH
jgi:antibiotic biosynthesis monooxygenase (ABM) superfamily enzyme